MGRPAGVVGRTQLKQDDLVRIQTLSRDARMGPSEIRRVTGYSIHQIKYALKKKTPTVGKRSGRPRKSGAGGGGSSLVRPGLTHQPSNACLNTKNNNSSSSSIRSSSRNNYLLNTLDPNNTQRKPYAKPVQSNEGDPSQDPPKAGWFG
ncbi:hypothetical protein B0I37DRAFT_354491 [Chaetomium sp. MPI-CAGE-AT-0009]|nr:hypothetical protein B0I37DRAFT_354491 [Chaetomium sp. MPI-CAGE-AT-0009]